MKKNDNKRKKMTKKQLLLITFLTAVICVFATYAWLSTTLNVKINFFKMSVQSDSGLFISLDGIDFSDGVNISVDSIITDLKETYPNHTNQWSAAGLWPVSTNGIKTPNDDKFEVYIGHLLRTKLSYPNGEPKRLLNTALSPEDEPTTLNKYIAFDVFLKNASGSPKSDNLYFERKTTVTFEKELEADIKAQMEGILNTVRIGIIQIGSVPHKTDINTIQNLQCNNECKMVIYDPYSTKHSATSIANVQTYGITMVDGQYMPTYAMTGAGYHLEAENGQAGTGIPLDTRYFALQTAMTPDDILEPIFEIPNGISKYRVYVWLEGQDVDSLETLSAGADINIFIELIKDLAGYE